jgi:hypothetical protein
VKERAPVPTISPTVAAMAKPPSFVVVVCIPEDTVHMMLVVDSHTDWIHAVSPILLDTFFSLPKFRPSIVTIAPPLVGEFGCNTLVIAGASYVNCLKPVPATPFRDTPDDTSRPIPSFVLHNTLVSVKNVVCSHVVTPSFASAF